MAFFGVTRQIIKSVQPIPDADRIELATLEKVDFEFVIVKGAFKPGDACLYIPIDSILPSALLVQLGLVGKLAGPEKNRLKTACLRGQISQGLVVPLTTAPEELHGDPKKLTDYLGVTKWDPPMNDTKDAILYPLSDGLSEYDIESAQRYQDVLELLMDRPVCITERLEGENACCRAVQNNCQVACRSNIVVEKPDVFNRYWKAVRTNFTGQDDDNLLTFATRYAHHCGKATTVYFELLGPGTGAGDKKNYYRFEEHTFRIFDIRTDFQWLNPDELQDALIWGRIWSFRVPVVAWNMTLRQWLGGRSLKEAADGDSLIYPGKLREGIVVRPMAEDKVAGFGRLQIKQHSLRYLAIN